MTDAPFNAAPGDGHPHGPHGGNPYRTSPSPLARFFAWIRSSGMVRGGERWFAGVCGAIARRTGLDPLIVRGIAVVAGILGAPILFAYAVGWALLPDERGRIHAEQAVRGIFEPAMIAIGALLLVTLVPFSHGLWWEGAPLAWGMPGWLETTFAVGWGIAVTVGLIWLVVFLARRMPGSGTRQGPGFGGAGRTGFVAGAAPYETRAYETAAAGDAGTATATAQNDTTTGVFPTAPYPASAAQPTEPLPSDAAPTMPYPNDNQTNAFPTAPFAASGAAATAPYDLGPYQTRPSNPNAEAEARAWREQRRQARADAHAWHREWHRQRHPGAGFSAIVLGLALAAGAVAAGVYSGVASGGSWSTGALLIGLAATLGALAVGIIVSGIRGRDSGAMGGFAFLAGVALIAIGLFPAGTHFFPFGAPQWTIDSASAGEDYALIGGQATVDLTNLEAGGNPAPVDVWVGFGETELILPADQPVRVETNFLAGAVDHGESDFLRGSDADRGGVLFHDVQAFNTDGTAAGSIPVIRVWSLAGYVNIVND